MNDDIKEILISEEKLKQIVTDLGARISADYAGRELLLVGVLKGSVVFMADIMRAVTIPCKIDFMSVSSYGDDTKSSGIVRIIKDLDDPVEGKNILIIEDILDSGRTLSYIMEILRARKPASIEICTLLDKPEMRKAQVVAKYSGARVPNEFVVGYGLDCAQLYRNLPYVGVLKPEKTHKK